MKVRLRGLPILWQALILVVTSVLIAQLIGFLMLVLNPPPRPQFNRLGDVVSTLKGEPRERDERWRVLIVHEQAAAPGPSGKMGSDEMLTRALAERLEVRQSDVRLYFEPDVVGGLPFGRPRRAFLVRHGEALFFGPIVTGVKIGNRWRVAETMAPPLIAPWQRTMLVWLVLSGLATVPLAWLFARAMARPIRRFAEAAERMGADPGAPLIAEEGPAELRTTARALNGMQGRIVDYVAERTEMIGAIAHDLRTPLARIAFRIEAAPEPMREKVIADVEQMRAMLAATIAFVRGTGDRQRVEVDLAALLTAIVDQDRDLGRPVRLESAESLSVRGDPLMLERLFQNLIDNGIAYAGEVEVAVLSAGGKAVVTVSDRGGGLSEEMLARAFQPFVRGDPSRNRATGGIGLGLSIARTIAEEHGGTIALANRKGGGLEARVTLPPA